MASDFDYQEPAKGNSALHMACARRDADAVMLLLYAGASAELRNHDNKRPMDMINLNFKEAYRLMAFHTSPDGHPGTFHLVKEEFNDQHSLASLRELANQVNAGLVANSI